MSIFKKQILWALSIFVLIGCVQNKSNQNTTQKEWAIVLHGGAGTISKDLPDSIKQAYMDDLSEALSIGEDALKNGEVALDVVEKVINYLENNPKFNAGKGAVFTHEGAHELDAAIMVGNTGQAGTITGVKSVKNPISLARYIMENSKHVMFAGDGAEEYANQTDLERVDQEYFFTQNRYDAYKRAIAEDDESMLLKPEQDYGLDNKFGTVGCVVLDKNGTIVAGTSTGGMTNKKYGRVGDVPVVGSGNYASEVVGVSMTGWGERIMRAVSGHTVSSYMKFKDASLNEAGDYLLNDVLEPGDAGMIAVDKYGNTYTEMNTSGMFRGSADSEGNREIAIWE